MTSGIFFTIYFKTVPQLPEMEVSVWKQLFKGPVLFRDFFRGMTPPARIIARA